MQQGKAWVYTFARFILFIQRWKSGLLRYFHQTAYRFEIGQRIGIPLQSGSQKLPNLSKEEFYDLCKFVLRV